MSKIKIGVALLVLLLIGIVVMDNVQNRIFKLQHQQLNNMQTQLDEIAKEQFHQKEVIDSLYLEAETLHQAVFGEASYYDYTLDSGWSSEGHRVCASRTYKRGTTLVVRNVDNNKEVECLVTDYGPDQSQFPERIIDLSSYAFSQIADKKLGVINVAIRPLNE